MKRMSLQTLPILVVAIFSLSSLTAFAQTVTLKPPLDPVTKKYNEGHSCYNFKRGEIKEAVLKETRTNEWDLGYGFMAIGDQDWFTLHASSENRSVIEDLGEIDWDGPVTVPVLTPLPELPKGKQREITVDSSADTHANWAKTIKIFAKVVLWHVYAIHIKNETDDFYVLFRVIDFEQQKQCTITWRRVLPPAEPETP
jgi:hypothetical protein